MRLKADRNVQFGQPRVSCAAGVAIASGAPNLCGMEEDDPICPLCARPIPVGARASVHHLVPKLKGGRNGPVVRLHQICHTAIHAAFSEAELARDYASIEALRAHPRIAHFLEWVQRRPPGFHARTAGGRRKRR